jgi:D-serine deaminase-like pyridoxal phosphate-dependent protein
VEIPWWQPADVDEISSPALLLYPDRIERNIRRMIDIAGGPDRLRPHVKTHKMAEIVRMCWKLGIGKFKCATIAEAEMTAQAGAPDVLLAYQPLGPNPSRLATLCKIFPQTKFSTIVDAAKTLSPLNDALAGAGLVMDVLLDIDCGMNRSGISAGDEAFELYKEISRYPALRQGGLHVYDGHINQADAAERKAACVKAFGPVENFRKRLLERGLPVPQVVAGGTPTFPIHAANPVYHCAPGTTVLWDFGYSDKFKDLPFEWAAVLLTRVVSQRDAKKFCLDLGYKAVASENPHPRVRFLNLPEAEAIGHSEEHLVIQTSSLLELGETLYGIPRHVCPTVALYSEAWLVRDGNRSIPIEVTARNRHLTV